MFESETKKSLQNSNLFSFSSSDSFGCTPSSHLAAKSKKNDNHFPLIQTGSTITFLQTIPASSDYKQTSFTLTLIEPHALGEGAFSTVFYAPTAITTKLGIPNLPDGYVIKWVKPQKDPISHNEVNWNREQFPGKKIIPLHFSEAISVGEETRYQYEMISPEDKNKTIAALMIPFVPGKPLTFETVKEDSFLQRLDYMKQLLEKLKRSQFIHRDLKGDNVLVNPHTKKVNPLDGGLTIEKTAFGKRRSCGTAFYAPPEQYDSSEKTQHFGTFYGKSDLFALAMMAIDFFGICVNGKRLFNAKKGLVLNQPLSLELPKTLKQQTSILEILSKAKASDIRFAGMEGCDRFDIDETVKTLFLTLLKGMLNPDAKQRLSVDDSLGKIEEIEKLDENFFKFLPCKSENPLTSRQSDSNCSNLLSFFKCKSLNSSLVTTSGKLDMSHNHTDNSVAASCR
jgi:serine/threonine protein kinase